MYRVRAKKRGIFIGRDFATAGIALQIAQSHLDTFQVMVYSHSVVSKETELIHGGLDSVQILRLYQAPCICLPDHLSQSGEMVSTPSV